MAIGQLLNRTTINNQTSTFTKYKGYFVTLDSLKSVHPSAQPGDFAFIQEWNKLAIWNAGDDDWIIEKNLNDDELWAMRVAKDPSSANRFVTQHEVIKNAEHFQGLPGIGMPLFVMGETFHTLAEGFPALAVDIIALHDNGAYLSSGAKERFYIKQRGAGQTKITSITLSNWIDNLVEFELLGTISIPQENDAWFAMDFIYTHKVGNIFHVLYRVTDLSASTSTVIRDRLKTLTGANRLSTTDLQEGTDKRLLTDALLTKLQNIQENYKGYFITDTALIAAIPTGSAGWWAIVESTDTVWIWNSDTVTWVNTGTSAPSIEIINTLVDTSTNKALSAAQGKVLKDLVDALSLTVSGISLSGNADAITESATRVFVSPTQKAKIDQFRGFYATEAALITAVPTGANGNYAIVKAGNAIYIWVDTAWVNIVNMAIAWDELTNILTLQANTLPIDTQTLTATGSGAISPPAINDGANYIILDTNTLSLIPTANISDYEVRLVSGSKALYYYDPFAVTGNVSPADQVGGIGFWVRAGAAGLVQNTYTTESSLLANQGSQTVGAIQRLSIPGQSNIWLEKVATSNGSKADYMGWPILTKSMTRPIDTASLGLKHSIQGVDRNKTIIRVTAQAYGVSTAIEIDVTVAGVSVLATPVAIGVGSKTNTGGLLNITSWDVGEELLIQLEAGTGTGVVITIETEEDDSVPILQKLSTPIVSTTPTSSQITLGITAVPLATSYEIDWKTGVGSFAPVPTYNGTNLSYVHTTLSEVTEYQYRIRALANGFATSDYAFVSSTTLSSGIDYGAQTDAILALPDLLLLVPCYEAASPMLDIVNDNDFTVQTYATANNAAIETTDGSIARSVQLIRHTGDGASGMYRTQSINLSNTWEISMLMNTSTNNAGETGLFGFRSGVSSAAVLFQIDNNAGAMPGRVSIRTRSKADGSSTTTYSSTSQIANNVEYLFTLQYNSGVLTLLRNGVSILTQTRTLSGDWNFDTIVFGAGSVTTRSIAGAMQKCWVRTGSVTPTATLVSIYNAGSYV